VEFLNRQPLNRVPRLRRANWLRYRAGSPRIDRRCRRLSSASAPTTLEGSSAAIQVGNLPAERP
jgi:hypothetical protein